MLKSLLALVDKQQPSCFVYTSLFAQQIIKFGSAHLGASGSVQHPLPHGFAHGVSVIVGVIVFVDVAVGVGVAVSLDTSELEV